MSAEIIPFPIPARNKSREKRSPRPEPVQLALPGASAWPEERCTRHPVPEHLVRQFLRRRAR